MNTSRALAILGSLIYVTTVFAVDANPWKLSLNSNLTATLSAYSKNWAGGDAGTVSWTAQLNADAEKQAAKWLLNKNTLKLAFGQTETQNKDTKRWAAPQKSTDLIDFETLGRFTLGGVVDPFIAAHVVSQFMDMRDTLLMRYGNPVDITESFGVARTIIKKDSVGWVARLGGSVRQGVDRHKLMASGARENDVVDDGGLEFVTEFKATTRQNWITFGSLLRINEALLTSKLDEYKDLPAKHRDDWRYPDVNWENSLTLNVTRFLMVNLYLQLLYDKQVHENAQLKNTSSLGLTVNLKTEK